MKSPQDWLNFFYPFFFIQGEDRYFRPEIIQFAIDLAKVKTPLCEAISADEYSMAVAFHAAAELSDRYSRTKGGQINLNVSQGLLIREKEGDLERQYGDAKIVTKMLTEYGTANPLERWKQITGKCDKPGFFLRSRRI